MPRGGTREGAGRPKGSRVTERTEFLHVRCARAELDGWLVAAEAAGLDLSNWVRGVLDGHSSIRPQTSLRGNR